MSEVHHRFVETNGIRMHIAEQGSGPLVLLLHGFLELWYSWRHQLSALAEGGFHVVAPDLRGFGQTDAPAEWQRYSQVHLVGDVVGLLDALGEERADGVGGGTTLADARVGRGRRWLARSDAGSDDAARVADRG